MKIKELEKLFLEKTNDIFDKIGTGDEAETLQSIREKVNEILHEIYEILFNEYKENVDSKRKTPENAVKEIIEKANSLAARIDTKSEYIDIKDENLFVVFFCKDLLIEGDKITYPTKYHRQIVYTRYFQEYAAKRTDIPEEKSIEKEDPDSCIKPFEYESIDGIKLSDLKGTVLNYLATIGNLSHSWPTEKLAPYVYYTGYLRYMIKRTEASGEDIVHIDKDIIEEYKTNPEAAYRKYFC